MKRGKRTPERIRERVIQLARDDPRLTNKAIKITIDAQFKETISERTILRLCQKARVPTRSTGPTSGAPSQTDLSLERHRRALLHFGRLLRDLLQIPAPSAVMAGIPTGALWSGLQLSLDTLGVQDKEDVDVEKEWGAGPAPFDARRHPLFGAFAQHLEGKPLQVTLNTVQQLADDHNRAFTARFNRIRGAIAKRFAASPLADQETLTRSVFVAGASRALQPKFPIINTYTISREQDGSAFWWRLSLGSYSIRRRERAELKELAVWHKMAVEGEEATAAVDIKTSFAQLSEAIEAVRKLIGDDFALEVTIRRGRCDLCVR